jgi:hypothetical protein
MGRLPRALILLATPAELPPQQKIRRLDFSNLPDRLFENKRQFAVFSNLKTPCSPAHVRGEGRGHDRRPRARDGPGAAPEKNGADEQRNGSFFVVGRIRPRRGVGFLRSATLADVSHWAAAFRQSLKDAGFAEGAERRESNTAQRTTDGVSVGSPLPRREP